MSAEPADTPVRMNVRPSYLSLKSWIDRYLGLVGLTLAAPLMGLIAVLIRRDSPGPAFFRQQRAGKNARPFTLYKFRTMRTDADPFGDSPESGQDARLTRLGRKLRENSLDELPQLLNVCRGEMSLVGPRPLYMQQIAEWSPRQRGRLLVKPGLTGLAQISGRGGLTIEEKLEWDVRYVESVSLRSDFDIIWQTIRNVWAGGGIYEVQYSETRKHRSRPEPPPNADNG